MKPLIVDLKHNVSDIYVIEWLDPGQEPETGTDLFRDVLAPATAEHPDIKSHLLAVREPHELLDALKAIEADARRRSPRIYPMLHLESHGNDRAIGRRLGKQTISFQELKPALVAINEACVNHLVVTLAACFGEHAIQIMEPRERAPAFAIIGIEDDIDPKVMAACFRAFYDTMIRTRNGNEAVRLMNVPLAGCPHLFRIVPAARMFCEVWNNYVTWYCSPAFAQERIDNLVSKIPRRGPIVEAGNPIAKAEEVARRMLDLESEFERMRDHFLMFDLDPRTRERFPIRYEDMAKPEGIL